MQRGRRDRLPEVPGGEVLTDARERRFVVADPELADACVPGVPAGFRKGEK